MRLCPINEQTGDGKIVGRCWFFLKDGKTCPRHGDVSIAVRRYEDKKELTLECNHERNSHQCEVSHDT